MKSIMHKSKILFVRFSHNNSGATAIEYGLLAAILSVGVITGAGGIGDKIQNLWNGISTDIAAS